jgi:hypothetical protein
MNGEVTYRGGRDGDDAVGFVSHASADLAKVRRVRNFMEENGAAPILFHLKALTEPERFWPLIEEEIAARNFFLLCDSDSARRSPWVQREQDLVRRVGDQRGIRLGRINLDQEPLDFDYLKRFLLNLWVFVVGDVTGDVESVFSSLGYALLGGVNFSAAGLKRLGDGRQMSDDMISQLNYAADRGWLLIILSQVMVDSENFWRELPRSSVQERVMFVLPKTTTLPTSAPQIPSSCLVVEEGSFEHTLAEAARRMLSGGSE